MAEGKDALGRLSEKDISRVRMVDGEPTLDGKPVSFSKIRGSQASYIAEEKIKRHEEGREDKYSGNTTPLRQAEQIRQNLQVVAKQREKATFDAKYAALQEKVRKSAESSFLNRTWKRLEQRFPRVMGVVGRTLDVIGGSP